MIPKVKAKIHDFRVWGLHNGVALVEDLQTRSRWDHITGECIHGVHRGEELEAGPMLQYFKAGQAARRFANAELALSQPPLRARLLHATLIKKMLSPRGYLPSFFFKATLDQEDQRHARMALGLGVIYKNVAQRFYPLGYLSSAGPVFDELADERLLIYVDPASKVPVAVHTNATTAKWEGEDLVLDNGERIRDRQRIMPNDAVFECDQPLQLFTRWYGFALTFPNCDIFQTPQPV